MAKSSLYNKISEIKSLRDNTITAYNLRVGINVFGVNGNYTNGANITSQDVVSGKIGYANGSTITGGLREYTSETIPIPVSVSHNEQGQNVIGTYYNIATTVENNRSVKVGDGVIRNLATFNIPYNTLSRLLNIQPMDIKKDKKVLDVTGQYDASTEFSGIKMDPVKPSDSSTPLTQSITDISGLDMTEGTNLYRYFYGLYNLKSISNISTPNVTNMWSMFQDCYRLASVGSVNFYNSSQTKINTAYLFSGCTNLKSIPNTVRFPKELSWCDSMFQNCSNLESIDTDVNVNNSYVSGLFRDCPNLVTLKNVQLNSVSATFLFCNCRNLVDVSNVTFLNTNINAYGMFQNCSNLNVSTVNIAGKNITDASYMFEGCSSLNINQVFNIYNTANRFVIGNNTFSGTGVNRIITANDITNIKSFGYMYNVQGLYARCNNITSVNLDDLSYIKSGNGLNNLFNSCSNLSSVTATNIWGTYAIAYMFANCTNLQTATIPYNNLYYVMGLFNNCTNLQTVNFLEGFNISSYSVSTSFMFQNCYNLVTINGIDRLLGSTNYDSATNMFSECHNLILSNNLRFNMRGTMNNMFYNCYNVTSNMYVNFNQYVYSSYNLVANAFSNIGSKIIDINWHIANNSSNTISVIRYCPNLQYSNISFTGVNSNAQLYATYTYNHCPNLYDVNMSVNYNAKTVSAQSYVNYSTISNQLYINLGNYAKDRLVLRYVAGSSSLNTLKIDGINMADNKVVEMGDLLYYCNQVNNIILNIAPNTKFDYIRLWYCTNVSNNALDTIVGTVATYNINSMNTYMNNNALRVEAIFPNCGVTAEILSNLPNTSKLLANGWKLMNNS